MFEKEIEIQKEEKRSGRPPLLLLLLLTVLPQATFELLIIFGRVCNSRRGMPEYKNPTILNTIC